MKRVQIPKDVQCSFIHSLPEAATPALAANFIASNGHSVVILVDENIPKAEEWGEDVASFLENLKPDLEIEFHLFDCAPESNHPDAFDKICDRLTVLSSLIQKEKTEKTISLLATTPDALISGVQNITNKKNLNL